MYTKRYVNVFMFYKGTVFLEYLYLLNRRQGGPKSWYIWGREKVLAPAMA
jgi:hypothetical protein